MVISLEVLLLLKIVLVILDFLFFHIKLRIALYMPMKISVGILMGTELNLKIAFGKIARVSPVLLVKADLLGDM